MFGSAEKSRREGTGKQKGYAEKSNRYVLESRGAQSGLPDMTKPFCVLGIETSCDDTSASVVRSDGTILSNVVYSQHEVHEQYGGIVPGLAMENHQANIDLAVAGAIEEAGLSSVADVDAIAVTKGPGLEICLRVGFRKAQMLAQEYCKPFVTTHHLESHCLIARLAGEVAESEAEERTESKEDCAGAGDSDFDGGEQTGGIGRGNDEHKQEKDRVGAHFEAKISYPFLALLASGGHTSLLLCKAMGNYDVIGATLDDALGEAFDKGARLVGVRTGGAGGAAVEALAKNGEIRTEQYGLKVPMQNKPNCDFSYAGLKNAMRLAVEKARAENGLDVSSTNAPARAGEKAPSPVVLPEQVQADLCATFQDVAISHVEDRVGRAIDYLEEQGISTSSFVVVGGVAANQELKRRLLALLSRRSKTIPEGTFQHDITLERESVPAKPWQLFFPPVKLCTDNGVMAAWAGIEKMALGMSDVIEGQEVVARWALGQPLIEQPGNEALKFRRRRRIARKASIEAQSAP